MAAHTVVVELPKILYTGESEESEICDRHVAIFLPCQSVSMNRQSFIIARLALVAVVPSLSGCSPAPPPSPVAAAVSHDLPGPNKEREAWEVYFLQGNRVGYGHTTARRDVESSRNTGRREVLRTESVCRLSLRRGSQTNRQEIRVSSVETTDGRLVSFESVTGMGPTAIRTTGRVVGDRLDLETTGKAAAPVQSSIAWSADVGGPFALEQSLARRPMLPGQRRALKMLAVDFQQAAKVEMVAKDFERTSLPDGPRELLRIESVTQLPDGQKIEQTIWTDRAGETLKISSPALGGLETVRATKAEALEKADAAEFDLLPHMTIKIDRPLDQAHRTRRIRYRVHLDGSDPAAAFAVGPSQSVRSIDANTAEITVYAIRPGQPGGNPKAPAERPTDNDLRPNLFIQCDDPQIVADARQAAGDERDPWRVAVLLERFVNRAVKKKDFSQTFATAVEVARSREGDCTEHAVYLAALARARKIPARVAIGLVYMEREQAFGYHLWTEVYIGERWVPIDGTLAFGGIGAGHLKIAQSDLQGATAYSSLLPVTRILGRLKIEVVDVEDSD